MAVSCQTAEKEKWSSVLTGIRFDKEVWDRTGWENVPQDALKMNVLMFGFDSLSRNTFIRKLPKSYKYLKEVLNTYILEGCVAGSKLLPYCASSDLQLQYCG